MAGTLTPIAFTRNPAEVDGPSAGAAQNPSANLASSVIISGDQGGSKIIFG